MHTIETLYSDGEIVGYALGHTVPERRTTVKRITVTDLRIMIGRLNQAAQQPRQPYTKGEDGHHHANVGCFHLSQAYGGYALHQMVNRSGGVRDVLYSGHIPARELYNRIHAYILGIEDTVGFGVSLKERA